MSKKVLGLMKKDDDDDENEQFCVLLRLIFLRLNQVDSMLSSQVNQSSEKAVIKGKKIVLCYN